jgi:hypothetical protein
LTFELGSQICIEMDARDQPLLAKLQQLGHSLLGHCSVESLTWIQHFA